MSTPSTLSAVATMAARRGVSPAYLAIGSHLRPGAQPACHGRERQAAGGRSAGKTNAQDRARSLLTASIMRGTILA